MKTILLAVVCLCLIETIRAGEICCDGFSMCFNNNPPCNTLPLPQCPETQGISMKVYTRENQYDGQELTRNSIPSVFISNVMTVFINHGWLQNENYTWMHEMKDEFLKQGNYNVIIVGWSIGALLINYFQSSANTMTVGAEIALRANFTIASGKISRSNLYCVGHSLGAHVCGHAGKLGRFPRATGLDPAGPWFKDNDKSCGINPSSADYVDNIHTNAWNVIHIPPVFGLGMFNQLGHVDFYVNGGSQQPGCIIDIFGGIANFDEFIAKYNESISVGTDVTLGCNHIRAYEFFIESIGSDCFRTNAKCTNQYLLPTFGQSVCRSSDSQSMGFYSNQHPGRGMYYLKTRNNKPFCLS